MSDFVIFLVEQLGWMPEEIQEFFYNNPDKLEKLYERSEMEELKKTYLKMKES